MFLTNTSSSYPPFQFFVFGVQLRDLLAHHIELALQAVPSHFNVVLRIRQQLLQLLDLIRAFLLKLAVLFLPFFLFFHNL